MLSLDVWITLHWHATLTQVPILTTAVTGANDISAMLSSSSVFVLTRVFAQPCCMFSMKLGTCIINFMLLNVLVGKLYQHCWVRKLEDTLYVNYIYSCACILNFLTSEKASKKIIHFCTLGIHNYSSDSRYSVLRSTDTNFFVYNRWTQLVSTQTHLLYVILKFITTW
jgi:hypothetical protein